MELTVEDDCEAELHSGSIGQRRGTRFTQRSRGSGSNSRRRSQVEQPVRLKQISYATHTLLLYFLDPEVEQRYFDFQYVDNMFIPGKMFAIMWTGITLLFFVFFTDPFHNDAAYTVEAFSSTWWVGSYISTALNGVLLVGLFLDKCRPYREIIHLLQIFIGWPTLALAVNILKQPYIFSNACLFMAFIFCMVIAQGRAKFIFPLMSIWPLVCLFTITFAVPGYWDNHTYIEMMYWVIFISPLLLLSFLERQTRKSFVGKEMATAAIAEIEHKTLVTQRMIANFFPATPTRDLLQAGGGFRDKAYPDTVLVVTDIAGFTAYTSRSSPPDVIDMLTQMFQAFDIAAETYEVEKIATVGDSYCGAVFPKSGSKPTRCMNVVMFSCSTLGFAGPGLQLRVGVHIGDVVGVFVGCAPPKFDLFGPGMDKARLMEEGGQPGAVHVSHEVLKAANVVDEASSLPTTAQGVICRQWSEICGDNDDMALDFSTLLNDGVEDSTFDAEQIVEALCRVAHIDPPAPVVDEDEADDGHSKLEASQDEEDSDPLHFSKFYLTFSKPIVEQRYQKHMEGNGINSFCSRLFVAITFALFVVQLNLQCGTTQDLGVASAVITIIAGLSIYLQFAGTNHRFHFPITFLAYNALQILTFLALRSDCSGLELRPKYISEIPTCYFCIALFAPQYCLNIKLTHRIIATLVTSSIMAICMIIRGYTIGDDVVAIDPAPLYGGPFVIMSFFPEFSLRSAFRTEMQLDCLRKVARSRGAAMSTSALSIMLPSFVTDRLISLAKDAKGNANAVSIPGSSSTALSASDIGDEVDFNGLAATWEYNHASVMFVKFHSDDTAFTPDTINDTVRAVEQIMKQFAVMKVKTIGSTIMLVAGIDDPRPRQEQLAGMVDAAIAMRSFVLHRMDVPDLTYRIGIHCGPCFGAVIGGNGAIFDLFGDTVNTASRMMSTAKAGLIQVSSAAHQLLLPRLREVVEAQPPVRAKGKGTMEAFAFGALVGVDVIPEFSKLGIDKMQIKE